MSRLAESARKICTGIWWGLLAGFAVIKSLWE